MLVKIKPHTRCLYFQKLQLTSKGVDMQKLYEIQKQVWLETARTFSRLSLANQVHYNKFFSEKTENFPIMQICGDFFLFYMRNKCYMGTIDQKIVILGNFFQAHAKKEKMCNTYRVESFNGDFVLNCLILYFKVSHILLQSAS